MANQAVVVFTFKSAERILSDGGTSSWRLNRNHARKCAFAVCTRNANGLDDRGPEGPEPHQAAFLIGKVAGVVASRENSLRYLIQFSEYALVNIQETWKGDRNPVRYGPLEEFGIDVSTLEWKPMPSQAQPRDATPEGDHRLVDTSIRPLSMDMAKKGLALTFGVRPEAIEITIRG